MTPALFDGIVALCSSAGFSPNIVNTSATWSSVLTLVESGEGVALVPPESAISAPRRRHLATRTAEPPHGPLPSPGTRRTKNPIQQNFLRLVRENKDRIQRTNGN